MIQEKPYHKMVIELDGHDATIIIQALQKNLERAKEERESFKAKQLEYILGNMIQSKKTFHNEWAEHIEQRSKCARNMHNLDIYPSSF